MTRTLAHAVRITMVALSLAPDTVRAQAVCASASQDPAVTARRWSPPLDRVISLHERGVSLRVALDRLAAAARVRLAYSAELLPLDRRVCVSYRSVPAGVALTTLLDGTSVEPVAMDSDRVVLAPARTPVTSAPGAMSTRRADVLDRVVVTGP
jgi:iron complex outermembrane recepter protein